MITQFNLYEKNIIKKDIPKWFFLVLNIHKNNVYESLMNMEFLFLKGISDDIRICNSFFDIRDLFLIMDGSEVDKLNDIRPIEYYNPDFFCNDNFKYLRRILQDEPQFSQRENRKQDITFSMTISKIFYNLGLRNKNNSKKNYEIIKYIKDCQYKLSDKLNVLYHLGQLHINSLNDFTKILLESLKEIVNSEFKLSSDCTWDKYLVSIEEYIKNKLTFIELKKLLIPIFTHYSEIFSHEGEWYNSNKSFKIPKNSILYFKENINITKEKIDEIVTKYGLNHIYQIKTVSDHKELFTILNNEYKN
jgi:hypothetical protein